MCHTESLSPDEKREVLIVINNRDTQNKILEQRSRAALSKFLLSQASYVPAFGKIYDELTKQIFNSSLSQDANLVAGETLETLRRLEMSDHNPLQAMKNIAYDKFRGHGIEVAIDADTKTSSFSFKRATELTFSFDATEANSAGQEALNQFREGLENRRSAKLDLSQSLGVRLTVTPHVVAELLGISSAVRLEFKPQPVHTIHPIVYVVGNHCETIMTDFIFDWDAREFRIRPRVTQPDKFSVEIAVNFEETGDPNRPFHFSKDGRFTTVYTHLDKSLPNFNDLPLLRVLEQLGSSTPP